MRSLTLLPFLTLLASALPSRQAPRGTGAGLSLVTYSSDIPSLDGKNVTACGGKFWIGGSSCTSCPDPLPGGASCPPSNAGFASIIYNPQNGGRVGLNSVVPGGQQVYVDASGELKYTQAHSGAPGDGADVEGFNWTPYKVWNDIPAILEWRGNAMYACPPSGATNGAEYQVFAKLPGRGCTAFTMAAWAYYGSPTWQYN